MGRAGWGAAGRGTTGVGQGRARQPTSTAGWGGADGRRPWSGGARPRQGGAGLGGRESASRPSCGF
jgi:hypothetical protein